MTQEEEAVSCSHCIQQEVVRQRKEYFEDLLNTIEKLSVVEAESGNEGDDLPITGDEFTEVINQLLCSISGCFGFIVAKSPLQQCMEVRDSGLAEWTDGYPL